MFWFTLSAVLLLYALRYRYPYFIKEALYVFRLFSVGYRLSKRKTSKPYYTLVDRFLDSVKKNPNKAFIRFQDDTYSYLDSDKQSNKIAMTLLKHANLHEGDTVALLMGNEPMFLWIWLALAKIGCSAAFLNYNIRSKSLLHCFSCCGAGVLIAAADNVNTEGMQSLTDKISHASDESIPADLRANVTFSSPAVYIYTSGTTGLPKAALINHQRLWAMAFFQLLCGVTSDDLFYVNLPLYHSAGFCLGFLGSIERGATVVLRRKFSASQFWNDCRKYNVTVIQYIGETMRYLCNTPKRFSDPVHNVRIAFGNGLRADVWRTFISRFGQIDIKEFYGATEGNMSFLNFSGKIGAVGRVNPFHKKLNPYTFIKYDLEQEMPVRNADGFCQEVAQGEIGLLVSKITERSPFYGYARDPKQTQKKKLYNVFEKGDVYFNSGDLFSIDQEKFIYFQDRVGDTFRWKGENVSSNEVSDMMTISTSIDEANVYGVTVPGHEGRIGMAVIVLKEGQQFDCDGIFSHVTTYLPSYARPRFIRIQNCLAVTCTFKLLKVRLVEEGFNPAVINDPLFILDETVKSYRPLTHEIYQSILEGHFKL
ncbi:very long-chain acyl-CoA synthetase isoform X2 [Xyrauchen texanus]|uniref:very long-chain acyl-CoA synthetase isoform X2 n=1 Tax=Xyrauchen texanus TaxID=154827 RepID=UPI0022426C87|nr:very long-chain acyl-CoA synthetase isoform X2 [Xyrauchen texanus]